MLAEGLTRTQNMASAKQNFFSIVLVGRPNPQILNHDFLVQNHILPRQEPFVRDLKDGELPFTEFFSTPPVAQIAYGKYTLLVQEDRYQAIDATGRDPATSPIIGITRRYFGDILRYTPFKLGGVNLNYDLALDGHAEIEGFDAALGIDLARASKALGTKSPTLSITASFPFEDGRLMLAIAKPKDLRNPVKLNFNLEFDYPDNMGAFLARLDDVTKIVEYRDRFFEHMGIPA